MSWFLPRPLTSKQRIWGTIGGVIIVGSIAKVCYFRLTRGLLMEQAHKSHLDATENYKEARQFAAWSAKDREERRKALPPLTPEQEQQMRAYLRMMQEHHAYNPDSEQA